VGTHRHAFVQTPCDRDVLVGLPQRLDAAPGARVVLLAMFIAAEIRVDALSYQRYPFATVATTHAASTQTARRSGSASSPSTKLLRVNYRELACKFAIKNGYFLPK
jgi:hypothetical protein